MIALEDLYARADAWGMGTEVRGKWPLVTDSAGRRHLVLNDKAVCSSWPPNPKQGTGTLDEMCRACLKELLGSTGKVTHMSGSWGNIALMVRSITAEQSVQMLLKRSRTATSWYDHPPVTQQVLDVHELEAHVRFQTQYQTPQITEGLRVLVREVKQEATAILRKHADEVLETALAHYGAERTEGETLVCWTEEAHPAWRMARRHGLLADLFVSRTLHHKDGTHAFTLPTSLVAALDTDSGDFYKTVALPSGWTSELVETTLTLYQPWNNSIMTDLANALQAALDIHR